LQKTGSQILAFLSARTTETPTREMPAVPRATSPPPFGFRTTRATRSRGAHDADRASEDAGRRVVRPDGPRAGCGAGTCTGSLPGAERHARCGAGATASPLARTVP